MKFQDVFPFLPRFVAVIVIGVLGNWVSWKNSVEASSLQGHGHGHRQGRIYGGSKAYQPHFAYMVFIKTPLLRFRDYDDEVDQVSFGGEKKELELGTCGGSIVSTAKGHRILTAAKCFDEASGDDITIVMGISDLSDESRAKIVIVPFSSVIIHPDYEVDSSNIHDNLAMIPLPSDFTPIVGSYEPINLPGLTWIKFDYSGEPVSTVGWGAKNDEGEASKKLLFITTTCLSHRLCKEKDGHYDNLRLCTDGSEGKGICGGDMGGPLVEPNLAVYTIVGVASYRQGNCSGTDPSYFSRVSAYLDWIADQ